MPNEEVAATAAAGSTSMVVPSGNGGASAPPGQNAPPNANPPLNPTDDSEGAVWRRLSLHEFLVEPAE